MKGRIILPVLLSAFLLASCSSGGSSYSEGATYSDKSSSDSYSYASEDFSNTSENDASDEYSADVSESDSSSNSPDTESGLSSNTIKKDMLVYTCNISIDVLNFDEAMEKYRGYLDSFGGFIETENYSDGGKSSSRWYNENEEKWQSYSATVRIPSTQYDDFCNIISELGDLRSKNASVENVSSEYYDLSTTLEIYEAKENRYMALLKDITDEEYALSIEKEITDLQIQIAKLKTRMNEIKTDVAYSYVNISINEVKQYIEEPIKTDTFIQRLGNTVSDTASGFLDFLETLLFVIIHILPYLILMGLIAAVIILVRKKIRAKRYAKSENISSAKQNEQANTQTNENKEK